MHKFAKESNEIEGITDTHRHLNHAAALEKFLKAPKIKIDTLVEFVKALEPNHNLRVRDEQQVWVGGHEGAKGSKVLYLLDDLLQRVDLKESPNAIHRQYEKIHPFTDCNGRSGRALWLWQMYWQKNYALRYQFLQMYYYMTLDEDQNK
jgi:Fic family protein